MKRRLPAGTWPSEITPELVSAAACRPGDVRISWANGQRLLWWDESRPTAPGGAQIVQVRGAAEPGDVLVDHLCRSRVHEYGGAAWWVDAETLWFVDADDQRIWRQDPGGAATPITPAPRQPRGLRFADGAVSPDGRWIIAVCEAHPGETLHPGAERRLCADRLVAVPAEGGELICLWDQSDFVAAPRFSADGGEICWLSWDLPDMPWDNTRLWRAPVEFDNGALRLGEPQHVAGGHGESIASPAFVDGELWWVTDRSDWWNLVAEGEPLAPLEAEVAEPQWVFGRRHWCPLGDGLVVAAGRDAVQRILVRSTPGEEFREVDPRITTVESADSDGSAVLAVTGSSFSGRAVTLFEATEDGGLASGRVVGPAGRLPLDDVWISQPQHLSFAVPAVAGVSGSDVCHVLYHPPCNPDVEQLDDERPPLVVILHVGPTSSAQVMLKPAVQFWTSRGFAVADLNYRGSTTYGRRYRELLLGNWGLTDVADAAAVVSFLASEGLADPQRAVIRGGSAGGFTVLAALAFTDVFAAGAAYYGVADLAVLSGDTHAFESGYVAALVGPDGSDVVAERSPLFSANRITAPLILFHGTEDPVVPVDQSRSIAAALRANDVPVELIEFEGEGHGFRSAAALQRSLRAELDFYIRVLGL
jgi:dipeptidyl aminopeptidase/acylaminoacyl peptidase